MIVRFQGGANAGHTVMIDNKKYVLHQVPVGILRDDMICVLGAGMVIDPQGLVNELKMLNDLGIDYRGRLFISSRAHIITPLCKIIEQFMEKNHKIGTTFKGIGSTYSEKALRTGLRAGDLINDNWIEFLRSRYNDLLPIVKDVYDMPMPTFEETIEPIISTRDNILPVIESVVPRIKAAMAQGVGVLFEGAQGTMLDIDWGTYPFVTSSNTTIGGVASGSGINPRKIDQVVGIIKAFTSRVGDGPFPTELPEEQAAPLRGTGSNPWDEYGSTTGRPRRIGWLDAVVLRFADDINGVDALAITKIDALDGIKELKVCRDYLLNGEILKTMPATVAELEKVEPIYDTLPGWSANTRGITNFDDLPQEAKAYIAHIEKLSGIPIKIISTGPNRSETIIRDL